MRTATFRALETPIGPLHGHKGHNVHSSMTIFLEDTQSTDTVLKAIGKS